MSLVLIVTKFASRSCEISEAKARHCFQLGRLCESCISRSEVIIQCLHNRCTLDTFALALH